MSLYEWISTGVLILFAAGTYEIVVILKKMYKAQQDQLEYLKQMSVVMGKLNGCFETKYGSEQHCRSISVNPNI